jgi:hypothetical protein
MGLKHSVVLTAGVALIVSSLAQAVTKPNTTITADSLAKVDGILSFCSRVDSKSSKTYLQGESVITNGHSTAEIASLRHSGEYGVSLASINGQLNKVAIGPGLSACKTFGVRGAVDFTVTAPSHASHSDH